MAEIWSGHASVFTLWENEFFNRSVGPVLDLGGKRVVGFKPDIYAKEVPAKARKKG